MAEVKWIKIVTDIFDDEKILLIETLPEADSIIVIWFKLLCLAGKQNNSGVFVMGNGIPYTDKMLSTIFRRKEAIVTLALSTFEQFGMVEIVNDAITIPNWGKHQRIESIEKNREKNREYQQNYRERQKQLTDENLRKPLRKENVRGTDKNRIDKNREEENISLSQTNACDAEASPKKKPPTFDHDAMPYKLAFYLDERIRENIPTKKPADERTLQRWAGDIDKINRLDGQPWETIIPVLEFCQDDSFWRSNILSGSKFREKFIQLLGKAGLHDDN